VKKSIKIGGYLTIVIKTGKGTSFNRI